MADCTTVECLRDVVVTNSEGMDAAWVLVCGFLVFFMQCGFTMLECGAVRSKNVSNIIFKVTIDSVLAILAYWMFGWNFAYGGDFNGGGNGFIGWNDVCLVSGGQTDPGTYQIWFFQWAFTATAATIVSGAVAERCKVFGYCIFSFLMSAFIYPVVAHWMWSSTGWLSPFSLDPIGTNGAFDFAGGGVVHLVGGTAALMGAIIIGPRRGRFGPKTESLEERFAREQLFRPHNRVLFALGALILWFGWYGFNCGSTLAVSGGAGHLAALVAVNTTLAAAGAMVTAGLLGGLFNWQLDVDSLLNGLLAGLVASTSLASLVEPFLALITGMVGGIFYFFLAMFLVWCRVDDPLQASPVHMTGAWSLFAAGIFTSAKWTTATYGFEDPQDYGLFTGGGWTQLGIQCLAIVCIFFWTAGLAGLVFGILKLLGLLRVTPELEDSGLDVLHGGNVYDFATPIEQLEAKSAALGYPGAYDYAMGAQYPSPFYPTVYPNGMSATPYATPYAASYTPSFVNTYAPSYAHPAMMPLFY